MVRSFTTDFGNELHILEVPDVVSALVLWVDGVDLSRLRFKVRHECRLFAKAMRIGGWSHTMGNIMKSLASRFKDWPQNLSSMRSICKVFRNLTYRDHIRNKLELPPEEKKKLKSFTAGFAKWRYETVPDVLTQICNYSEICKRLHPALFPKVQDQEEMGAFFNAISRIGFWRWARTSNTMLFTPLERLRRWGMVCDCHREERKARKTFINCPRNNTSTLRFETFNLLL